MNLSLDMSMKLQQKLSFQMIQSLKLLQVNTLQLEQVLKTELEMNPVLETTEELEEDQQENVDEEKEEKEEEEELEVTEDEIDWEEYLDDGFDMGSAVREEREEKDDSFEPVPVYHKTLPEHLEDQLAEKRIDDEEMRLCAQFLIGSLDSDGYLRIPLEEIAKVIHLHVMKVEEALNIIWNMDPPGIGARNLRECLMLQLQKRGQSNSLAYAVLERSWDLLEKMKIPEIARAHGVSNIEIQQVIEAIKALNPKPGYLLNPDDNSTIIPDLIVEKVDGKYEVMLNDRSVPMLHISRRYADMIRRGSQVKPEIKKYVREKLNGATWLIRSIEQRKATMFKVMYAIIDTQPEFFEKGPPHLAPLKLQDVADAIDMHISTVSRVTSNKYVQTEHGIFELKYFFTEAVGGQNALGGDISSERVRNRIRELVEGEDSHKPLSDQKISDILKRENLSVARRTVAKYREQLKILPARMRQKYE